MPTVATLSYVTYARRHAKQAPAVKLKSAKRQPSAALSLSFHSGNGPHLAIHVPLLLYSFSHKYFHVGHGWEA